jgi:hypothetical protein
MTDSKNISHYVEGDLSIADTLKVCTPEQLASMALDQGGYLQVNRTNLSRLVERFQKKELTSNAIKEWASFVRRGYFRSIKGDAVKPVPIAYEARFEELIADVVARLDEIGDKVDGTITDEELGRIASSLKNPL